MSDAGRDLDRSVATEVMGYRIEERDGEYVLPELRTVAVSVGPDGMGNPEQVPPLLPRYSTDIAEAWEVVDRLNAAGLRVLIEQDWPGNYGVRVWDKSTEVADVAWFETAPEAICWAALKAVRRGDEGRPEMTLDDLHNEDDWRGDDA